MTSHTEGDTSAPLWNDESFCVFEIMLSKRHSKRKRILILWRFSFVQWMIRYNIYSTTIHHRPTWTVFCKENHCDSWLVSSTVTIYTLCSTVYFLLQTYNTSAKSNSKAKLLILLLQCNAILHLTFNSLHYSGFVITSVQFSITITYLYQSQQRS